MRTNTKKKASSVSRKAPSYIDERVLQEINRRKLRIITEKSEQNAMNRSRKSPFSFVVSKKQGKSLAGIKVRRRPPYNTYACNAFILRELGRAEDAKSKLPRSRYGKEKHAWKNAEAIRKTIGFPARDKKTGQTWESIRQKSLLAFEPVRINKHDWVSLAVSAAKIFGIQFAIFMGMFMISFFFLGVGITTYFWDLLDFFFHVAPVCVVIAIISACLLADSGHLLMAKYLGISKAELEMQYPVLHPNIV